MAHVRKHRLQQLHTQRRSRGNGRRSSTCFFQSTVQAIAAHRLPRPR